MIGFIFGVIVGAIIAATGIGYYMFKEGMLP